MINRFITPSEFQKILPLLKVVFYTTCFLILANIGQSQTVNLTCQTEVDGVLELDRKNWNGGSSLFHSEGTMHNFDFPTNTFGDCKFISNVDVEITIIDIDVSNLAVDCPVPVDYYINIATGCPSFMPATCDPSNFIYEAPSNPLVSINIPFTNPPVDFQFGDVLSVDIVPVMNTGCSAGQSAFSSGGIVIDYQICVTLIVSDATPSATVDLGNPVFVCPGETTMIDAGTFDDYNWSPGGETTQIITAGVGTYNVTVTDDVGCTSTDEVSVIEFADSGITFDPASPTVCDNALVSVSVNESYGSYMWSNSISGQTVDLSPGLYDVTITDANNCTAVNSIMINNVPPPNAGMDNNAVVVCNDNVSYNIDGELGVHDAGGTWTDDNSSGIDININPMAVDFSGTSPGTYSYTYTVTGTSPCPLDQATITVEVFEQNNAGISAIEQYCADPGNLDFYLLIGNPNMGGVWSDLTPIGVNLTNPFAVNFNGIPPGTYDFQYLLTQNGPCPEQSEILSIIILDSPNAGMDDVTTVCEGTQFDLMTLVDGANGPGTFFDTDGSSALSGSIFNTTGLAGQSFNFTFTVGAIGNPCGQDEAIFTVNIESSLSAGSDVSDSFCTDGNIDLYDILTNEDLGGTFFDVNFSGGLSGSILTTTNIIPGIYSYQYVIGDGITCPQTSSLITITFVEDPSFNFTQSEIDICEGFCEDIQIDLSGLAPFNFPIEIYSATTGNLITSIDTTLNANVLTFTTCNIQGVNEFVNDTLNLVSDSMWYVTIPSINDVNCTVDNISNSDTLIINTISNSYFQLDTTACITDTLTIGSIMLFDGNAMYQDTINGIYCDSIIDINVTFMDIDSVMIDSTICSGDSIMIQGIWFSESIPNAEVSVLNPNGCDSLLIIDVSFFPPIDTLLDLTLCTGDSIIVDGVVYNFSNPIGSEVLTAMNGCDSTVEVSLMFSDDIMLNVNDTLCMDGFIEINGEVYDISNPTGIEMLTGSGCDTIIDINLSFHEEADSLISGFFCTDFEIIVNGEIYNFNNSTGSEILLGASQYGCDSIVNIDLEFHAVADSLIDGIFCPDFSIDVNGVTFDINNPIGSEILTIPSQFGCDSIVNIDLVFETPVVFDYNNTVCDNDSLEVNGVFYSATNTTGMDTIFGGSVNGCDSIVNIQFSILPSYNITLPDTINGGDSIFLAGEWQFTSGTYVDNYQTVDMCDSIITTELFVNSTTTTVILSATNNVCAMDSTGSITLTINTDIVPSVTIIWEGDNSGVIGSQIFDTNQSIFTIDNLISDNYSIRINDINGVSIYQGSIVIVDDNSELNGSWIVTDSILCRGELGSFEFQVTGGVSPFNYNWEPMSVGNTISAQDVTAGQYFLTVIDQVGCTLETEFIFTEPDSIVATVSVLELTCLSSLDGEISISDISGGTQPYSITVNGQVSNSMTISSLDTGIYIIEVIDAKNCSIEITEELSVESNTSLGTYTELYQIEEGDSITLAGTVIDDNFAFEWIDPDGTLSCTDCPNPVSTPSTTTSYILNVMDGQGCSQTFNIEVEVTPKVLVNIHPNVFSPNGDNSNDEFIFMVNDQQVTAMTLSIFDRWGNLVSINQSTENEVSWDGTKNGSILTTGVFVYQAIIQFEDGTSNVIFGDVLLLK